jgi:hypothetical protein
MNTLSDECYDIILAIHLTGLFKSRIPNKQHPSRIHLQVQDYLNEIYNGSFMHHGLVPLKGDWEKVKGAVLGSLPIERGISVGMAEFFWNPQTNKSQFLMFVRLNPFEAPTTRAEHMQFLRKRELALDLSRCSSLFCPKYELCLRAQIPKGEIYSVTSFYFNDQGCDNFIGE